jgi:endonuclease
MKKKKKLFKKSSISLLMLGLALGINWAYQNYTRRPDESIKDKVELVAQPLKKGKKVTQSKNNKSKNTTRTKSSTTTTTQGAELGNIPEFDGQKPYIAINNNVPSFTEEEKTQRKAFESYGELDSLKRVTQSEAVLGRETMPAEGEKRGSISRVKPTGWGTYRFAFVDGGYLYNRSHMIGWQLSGENANPKNLATGTRFFNVDGMLPFENMVASYIKETGNHVRYRVTPHFEGDELVMRGLQMEAYSVEDEGEGVSFNVYVYNNQPGVYIDYLTGMAVSE